MYWALKGFISFKKIDFENLGTWSFSVNGLVRSIDLFSISCGILQKFVFVLTRDAPDIWPAGYPAGVSDLFLKSGTVSGRMPDCPAGYPA
jgi:hypothetical protein